jgi:hypothetical protein
MNKTFYISEYPLSPDIGTTHYSVRVFHHFLIKDMGNHLNRTHYLVEYNSEDYLLIETLKGNIVGKINLDDEYFLSPSSRYVYNFLDKRFSTVY